MGQLEHEFTPRLSQWLKLTMQINTSAGGEPRACWLWRGAVNPRGYPRTLWAGTRVHPRRPVWEQTYGAIENLLFVCADCGNRLCVRPQHLFLSDQRRHSQTQLDGPTAPNTITNDVVTALRSLRARGHRIVALADRFHLSVPVTSRLIYRIACQEFDSLLTLEQWIDQLSELDEAHVMGALEHTGRPRYPELNP